jgi:hypothetical protein
MSEMDALTIELLALGDAAVRERLRELEDECAALRALAQSRADDAATLRRMVRVALAYIYREIGAWHFVAHPTVDERNLT